tara:strand:+ start:28 stop:1131 length:1104 start_codon:yes stop_codon:yes gene_type:complete
MSVNHNKWMSFAILQGLRCKGATKKNPPVGCVIVKNDILLSYGRTGLSGRPHAEEEAINKVLDKKNLVGSTMYVTLEPCAHKNLSGVSCAEQICKSGIKEVYVSCIDPDPRTNNKGIKILKKKNIIIHENFMNREALKLYDGFFSRILKKRPFITLKIACSLDGKIALKNNKSKWITNELSRSYSHFLRSQNDAIMTSSSTILNDNPRMDCRLNGLEKRSPTKIILDRYLKITSNYNIYNSLTKNDIFVYSLLEMKHHLTENKFVKKIKVDNKLNDKCFFNFIFNDLANKGINNLLIETGSIINTLLLSLNLVDELVIFRSGNIIGNDGLSFVNSLNFKEINELSNYKISYSRYFQDDILEIRNFAK